jgi:TRAP-type C4-dicarboxylate transport system substrate-binding protein
MSWADAQPALSTGAVDGQENPLTIFTVAKLHTVGQKHVTLWHYVADPLIFAVNKDVFASFSPEDQKILREAAVEAAKYNIEIARKGVTPQDQSVLKDIGALGVEIVSLTPEQLAAFRTATKPVYEKWKARVGAGLVDTAEKSIAAK